MTRILSIMLLCLTCSAQVPPLPPIAANRPARPQTSVATLVWNPSVDPTVAGYNVYYGVASRTYTNKLDVGIATNATVNGLVVGATYHFAATAYNLLGVESDYSSEVSYTVPAPQPKPVIIRLTQQIMSAPTPEGPWTLFTNLAVATLTNPSGSRFYRPGKIEIK